MPKFNSLEDARRVVEVAKQAYDHNPKNPRKQTASYIGAHEVTVVCRKAPPLRVNCAVQQSWTFTGSRKELAAWWEGLVVGDPSGTYIFKKRKKKLKKGWQVNLLYKPDRRGQRLFNFHFKVPAKKNS